MTKLLLAICLLAAFLGCRDPYTQVPQTTFDHCFERIGQPGQSHCLTVAGREFLRHKQGTALLVIGRVNGAQHAWVVVDGRIIDYLSGFREPLVAFDGYNKFVYNR